MEPSGSLLACLLATKVILYFALSIEDNDITLSPTGTLLYHEILQYEVACLEMNF